MEEKTAVVTGAGRGIGRAVAIRLARSGHRVVGIGKTREPLEALSRKLETEGLDLVTAVADVSDPESLAQALHNVNPIHVVVANAGICRPASLLSDDDQTVWKETLAVNLDGVFHTIRACMHRLVHEGRIIAVSSGLGKQGRAGYAAYCASKHGVIGLVRALALELAPRGITINAVCPGWVETDMARTDLLRMADRKKIRPGLARREALDSIPQHRFVQPAEVAGLIAWLVSDQARAITGQAINISCGEVTALTLPAKDSRNARAIAPCERSASDISPWTATAQTSAPGDRPTMRHAPSSDWAVDRWSSPP